MNDQPGLFNQFVDLLDTILYAIRDKHNKFSIQDGTLGYLEQLVTDLKVLLCGYPFAIQIHKREIGIKHSTPKSAMAVFIQAKKFVVEVYAQVFSQMKREGNKSRNSLICPIIY